MEQFFSWGMLLNWATFVSVIFGVTQFLKDIKYINKIPTKYMSFFIAFVILFITHIATGTFAYTDILLYFLSAIFAGMNANGIYDFRTKESDNDEQNIK